MRIPREFIDLLGRFFDVAHERGVLTADQSVFELRVAAGRAAADAVAIAAEHSEGEPDASYAVALFVERFPAEALRDEVVTPAQLEPIARLLGEMARRDPIL
jgi:hypothetical protein